MNLPPLQFVVCHWADAWVDGTESVDIADAHLKHKPSMHSTTGWLIYQNEHGVSVANEYCHEDGTYRGRTFVPAGMLVSVHPVKLSKVRTPSPKKPKLTLPK